jgi:hypothetical protein
MNESKQHATLALPTLIVCWWQARKQKQIWLPSFGKVA